MSRAPFRSRAVSAVVGTGLLFVLLAPLRLASAQTEPTGGDAPSMELVGRSPWVTPEGTIDLDIATEGSESAVLQVVIREPVDSVEELETSLEENVGGIVHRSTRIAVGFVGAQADGSRRISIPTSTTSGNDVTARLAEPGVYPVVITLADDTGVVDEIRTPVVRLGTDEEPLLAPRIELLADLTVDPTVRPDGRRDLEDAELDRLDRLASLLDGSALGAPVRMTMSVSPDTLDALTASADPRAAAVLDAVTEADTEALGSPTVPVSAPAFSDAGLESFLVTLIDEGRSSLDDRIEADVDTTLWDGGWGVDGDSASLLASTGISHVLLEGLDPSTGSAAVERRLLDAGPVTVPGAEPLDVLLADTDTARALSARSVDRADAGHIALADLIVRDDGEQSRIVLRLDDAPQDSLLLPTLDLLADPEAPVPLGPVRTATDVGGTAGEDGTEDTEGTGTDVLDDIEPPPGEAVDLRGIADRVRATADAVDSFASLVGPESARADDLRLRIATSVASGVEPDTRTDLLDSVDDSVDDALSSVTLGGQTDLNLTSRNGTLPLRIHNDNDFPVEVVLHIASDRLRFPQGGRREILATEEITRVDIPVEAQATGSVPTFVSITTPDGRITLDERRLNVRSTAISGVGLALSLGALAVLIIWWARTWRRNRRASTER